MPLSGTRPIIVGPTKAPRHPLETMWMQFRVVASRPTSPRPSSSAEPRHDDRDDGHEVELADQRLEHCKRVAEVPRGRVVAVAERRERDVAEVEAKGARAVGALREEGPVSDHG